MTTETTAGQLEDLSSITTGKNPPGEWDRMYRAMRSGRTIIVSESVGDHFLNVLPPRWIPDGGAFAYCEGDDSYTVFVRIGEKWLARTLEYGERAPATLWRRASEMSAAYGQHPEAVAAEA